MDQSGGAGSGIRGVLTDMVLAGGSFALIDFCCPLSWAFLRLSHGASQGGTQGAALSLNSQVTVWGRRGIRRRRGRVGTQELPHPCLGLSFPPGELRPVEERCVSAFSDPWRRLGKEEAVGGQGRVSWVDRVHT